MCSHLEIGPILMYGGGPAGEYEVALPQVHCTKISLQWSRVVNVKSYTHTHNTHTYSVDEDWLAHRNTPNMIKDEQYYILLTCAIQRPDTLWCHVQYTGDEDRDSTLLI